MNSNKQQFMQIWHSGRFDQDWYLQTYKDVANTGLHPILHYLNYGTLLRRDPNPLFSTEYYLEANPDVALQQIDPFIHYIAQGQAEGRACAGKESVWTPALHTKTRLSKLEFPSAICTNDLNLQTHGGKQKWKNNCPTILACAHVAGKNIFGGERSFLDIIEGLQLAGFNVISTAPKHHNQAYMNQIEHASTHVVTFNYKWWTDGIPINELFVATFERLIRLFGVDAVHTNTIMLREPLIAAKRQGVRSVVHVREIIEHDEALAAHIGESPDAIKQYILSHTDFVVANSLATSRSMNSPMNTFIVENCLDIKQFKKIQRKPSNTINVALISSNIPKKGIHDFVELAQKLSTQNPRVKFLMVGPINSHVEALQAQQAQNEIPKNLQFPGYFSDSAAAYELVDIVVNLSHFQESFGRTVLESMLAGKPVVAYDWGAVSELVQHGETGYLSPFRDIDTVAEFVGKLAESPELRSRMGKIAQNIAVTNYSKQAYAAKLKHAYDKILVKGANIPNPWQEETRATSEAQVKSARVTVIIPNYNYAQFLNDRIDSILNQTVAPLEILFLDDNSTDLSPQLAKEKLDQAGVPYKLYSNHENKGTYKQWLKGIREARGDFIWIAEADDSCEPDFLERLLPSMLDHRTVLAYCQSLVMDELGTVIRSRNLHHTDEVSKTHWLSDHQESGVREVVDRLVYRNTIPNVSACLFRCGAIQDAIEDIESYRFCGDWSMYCRLMQRGNVAFIADPLNHFRRHSGSVTHNQGRSLEYLRELLRIKRQLMEDFPIHPRQLPKIKQFLDTDHRINGLDKNSDWGESQTFFSDYSRKVAHRRRYVMLTTNNGSFNGGSEMLWIESAMHLRALGHDIMVIIKDWDPPPSFFDDFDRSGISIQFKNGREIDAIREFNPDLIIVSTGDQDEGTEYFEVFIKEKLPYVIVNQLSKQTEYWPLREAKIPAISAAYEGAVRTFFTCWNNHRVMESRLACNITNAELHYNPYHIDRDVNLPFPSLAEGVKMAVPAKLLHIHKGQKLIIELMSHKSWKARDITISFYGEGPDEEEFKTLIAEKGLKNFKFFPRVADLLTIWRENHVILMSSFMEGLPIVLVGAMLCGRVPILTDIGAHAEVVEDNVSGFIAPKPTVKDLDNALSRAMARIEEFEQIGLNARQSILNYLPADPVEDFAQKIDACCLDAMVSSDHDATAST